MSPARPSLPLAEILADAGWVRRLAARLVADPGTADDLAQETLVAAWRHPPAPGTPARPWLARVLRNFARQRARSEDARAAREHSSARGGETPDDLLERAELAQRLARLVLELDEPYRTSVLRRFFDGWSAEEIAREEGTIASTVRTRLERGLAKLRERLERERGGDWMAALLPLVPMKSSAALTAGITGGIVVGTATKIALGLCAAGICGWIFWPRAEPLAPALEPPTPPLAQANTPLESSTPVVREAQPSAPVVKAAPAKPAAPAPLARSVAPGTIEGLVVRLISESENPIAGAQVQLWPAGASPVDPPAPGEASQATTRSAADGSFRFTHLAPGSYTLQAHSGNGPLRETRAQVEEQRPGIPVKIAFGGTRIHGRAFDEEGNPLANIPIRLDGGHEFRFELAARATTDVLGQYSFDELPAGKYFGLVTEVWQVQWPGRMWDLTLEEGDDLELDLGEPHPLPRWRGNVRSANGELAQSGGTLHLERTESFARGSSVKTYREVLFDGSARFDVLLESGGWHPGVSLRSKPDTRRMFEQLTIGPNDLEHDLVLAGARVHGTVLDSLTQKPLEGYTGTFQVSARRAGANNPGGLQTVDLEAGAQFAIDMLEEGDWEIVTYPLVVAASGQKLAFTILPGETEKQVDVQVRAP